MKIRVTVFVTLVFVLPQLLQANVKLNALFSDNMVVQRNTEIPIWGWADVNENIYVEASWGEKAHVVTAADGTWKVKLKTPQAGGPHKIVVSGNNTITINNVLSGEVWLCTGQSNMDFAMSKFVNNSREPKYQPLVEYVRNEIATAKDDWLRHIEVPQTTSLHEKKYNFTGNWISVTPEQTGKITATGYFFAKQLRKLLNVPVGLVECSWGGSRIQPWLSETTYMEDENLKAYFLDSRAKAKNQIALIEAPNYVDKDYERKLKVWKKNGQKGRKPKPTITNPKDDRQQPATLYNGMLSSVIPYKIKGAIWYQGESNAVFKPNEYEYYLTSMIKNWRADWNQGDFPFYFVQLASCIRANQEADTGWATVNDQMRRALKVPNTGMAVLYDIGEAKDIHPHNKMDVGKRLALLALKKDYNLVIPAVNGPLYKSKTIDENKIEIEFNEVGSGLMVGKKVLLNDAYEINEPLKWFEIAGKDNIWKPAEAIIISNNKIKVWSAEVPNPIHVRYAWSGNPEGANLYNKEGLPAAVFSTE
ncbi:sialate O-acetylesterase [Jejuia pallidilutea]|uniref:Sialate O-acetylesterase n=1 Tax=Jejuia pallidilutea TaxID=504487 RepID=A0A362X0G7_9FLAO|nr:sialate O-acetylesterase [Jejuia pallidilutea]PQV49016.1 sialate O-acetylesterase [Jejuia pallidilutea]